MTWIAIFIPLLCVVDAVLLALGASLWPLIAGNITGLVGYLIVERLRR